MHAECFIDIKMSGARGEGRGRGGAGGKATAGITVFSIVYNHLVRVSTRGHAGFAIGVTLELSASQFCFALGSQNMKRLQRCRH